MINYSFEGKVVLVTGASRGIGQATAREFARSGARVAVHYNRDRVAAETTLSELDGHGHRLFQADQIDFSMSQRLIEDVVYQMGRLDILVNNAGIFIEHKIDEVAFEEWFSSWTAVIGTNLLGPAHLTYWAVKQMIAQGGGRIVNVSSRGAFRGEPEAPAYGASKAGLNAMSQSLARALARHNIYVCVVAPGWVDTDMASDSLLGESGVEIRMQSPLGRIAYPEEVARTIVFLSSEGTEFLTGAIVDINGASYLRT